MTDDDPNPGSLLHTSVEDAAQAGRYFISAVAESHHNSQADDRYSRKHRHLSAGNRPCYRTGLLLERT